MREHWRAVRLLVRTAYRTDPWRCAGLLLETFGSLWFAVFGWCLKLMTDAALTRDVSLMTVGAAGIVATRALAFVGTTIGSTIRMSLAERVGFAFDREIATLTAGLPGLEHHERADVQDRLELLRQAHGVLGKSLHALVMTVNAVVAGGSALAALALASPWLLLLVPFALPALPIGAVKQRWSQRAEEHVAPLARLFRHLRGLILDRSATMELRVFGLQREVLARLGRTGLESDRVLSKVERRGALLDGAGDLVFLAGFAGAIVVMFVLAEARLVTMGDVVMAVYLCQQVKGSVTGSIRRVAGLGRAMRAAGRILWMQDYAREASARFVSGRRAAPARLREGILFEDVSFRYPGTQRWALRHVTLRLDAGTVVAFVGENGAGKSTLVKLLCRMYEPTAGRILIDGVDLSELDVDGWRARVSAAFQDFARLEFVAQRAVGVGDLARLDDGLAARDALARAGCSDVLQALSGGLGAVLGARWQSGVDPSAGQWQKLALGRAMMREEPLLMVFDEPTASLDALAEHALFERFRQAAARRRAAGGITALVSHRFSTVRSADLIVVTHDGGVAELGSHAELLRRRGIYAELYGMQARAYAMSSS
jgi:ATP-binding cassette subfamily B protein